MLPRQWTTDLEANLDKVNGRIQELEKELAAVHATIQTQAVELAQLRERLALTEQAHQEQRKQAAQEAYRVAERLVKAETERDNARKAATSAREEAARLRGQIELLQTQVSGLMRALPSLHVVEGEGKSAIPPGKGAAR